MANTDPVKLKGIAKHLSSLTDESIQLFIDDAYQEVQELGVNEVYEERLTRYLAAHLASLNVRQTQLEQVGPMRKSYTSQSIDTNKGLDTTTYGQEYKRLMRKYTGRDGLNLVVI